MAQKTRYDDGFLQKAFVTVFARKMEKFVGKMKDEKKKGWFEYDYESFVDVSKRIKQGRNRLQQQQVGREVHLSMLPPDAPAQVSSKRNVQLSGYYFHQPKWGAGFNAALTVPFFHWLVGPSEIWLALPSSPYAVDVELNGVNRRSAGTIWTCIFDPSTYLEDMSCEMVYGQVPPAFDNDLVIKWPCFSEICEFVQLPKRKMAFPFSLPWKY
ncbi:hypothetical protein RJ641_035765 [Dillenia turbinata]|uniref:Uncharacterized protein n=1 Tax=Dillenia turbinata TaxID=194707 RepID=A0AAN8ZIM1_9MAGN